MTVNEWIEELRDWAESGFGECDVKIPSPTGGLYEPDSAGDDADGNAIIIS